MLGFSWMKPSHVCHTPFEQVRSGQAACQCAGFQAGPQMKKKMHLIFKCCWVEEGGCAFAPTLYTAPAPPSTAWACNVSATALLKEVSICVLPSPANPLIPN